MGKYNRKYKRRTFKKRRIFKKIFKNKSVRKFKRKIRVRTFNKKVTKVIFKLAETKTVKFIDGIKNLWGAVDVAATVDI